MIICPECNHEIKGKKCPGCGEDTPLESIYCMYCGIKLDPEKDTDDEITDTEEDEDADEFDFENRVLCSDGTCTGIIINGKCSECGKPPEGK